MEKYYRTTLSHSVSSALEEKTAITLNQKWNIRFYCEFLLLKLQLKIDILQGDETKKALNVLRILSNSQSVKGYTIKREILKNITNDDFMEYFKNYEKQKEKWVFCFMGENRYVCTNMQIEPWHKTLKYLSSIIC